MCLFAGLSCNLTFSAGRDTIVVDRNGRGDYRNLQDAIDALRAFNPEGRVVVYIRSGFYKEKIELPAHLTTIKLLGESRDETIINYDDHATIDKMGTFRSYTFMLRGNDVVIENLTIENSALPLGQAVALHVEGDRAVFRNCRFLGNQDTVYAGRTGSRLYFENCYIEGTTDFIFGPAIAWFESCEIVCKKNSYITAANTDQNQKNGFIFNRCDIKLQEGVTSVYLGRPWRPYASTLFMNCNLPAGINPEGWDNWRNAENEKTARYMEYNNRGAGAGTSQRAAWIKLLTDREAKEFQVEKVMTLLDGWNPAQVQ
jgi:pectinesterase